MIDIIIWGLLIVAACWLYQAGKREGSRKSLPCRPHASTASLTQRRANGRYERLVIQSDQCRVSAA